MSSLPADELRSAVYSTQPMMSYVVRVSVPSDKRSRSGFRGRRTRSRERAVGVGDFNHPPGGAALGAVAHDMLATHVTARDFWSVQRITAVLTVLRYNHVFPVKLESQDVVRIPADSFHTTWTPNSICCILHRNETSE